jgi:hypothetical protein
VTGTQDTKRNPHSLSYGASFQWQAHFTTANVQRMDKIMETVVKNVVFLFEYGLGPLFACNTACLLLGMEL